MGQYSAWFRPLHDGPRENLRADRQAFFIDVERRRVQARPGGAVARTTEAEHAAGHVLQVCREVFAAHAGARHLHHVFFVFTL